MNKKNFGGKLILRNGLITALSVITAILIAFFSYAVIGLLPSSMRKFDMRQKKITEPSETAREYINSVSEETTIYVISTAGNEDTLIVSFLERIAELSGKIKLSFVDPAVEPSFISKYSKTDLEDNSLIVVSDKRSKVVRNYDMYVFSVYDNSSGKELGQYLYDDFYVMLRNYSAYFTEGVYSYDQMFNGENAVLSAIDYATTDMIPTVLTLSGHGELSVTEQLLSSLRLDNIACDNLIITPDTNGSDINAECIIINSPTSDISENELSVLCKYADSGGNIILLTSYEALDLKDLMKLGEKFGLSGKNGYIYENDPEKHFGNSSMILPDCSSASTYLNLGSYVAAIVSAHPITVKEDDSLSVSYVRLFTTSETSRFKDKNDENTKEDDSDPEGSYCTGIVAATAVSKFAWISSPYFTDSSVNSYVNGGNNIYFVSLCEKLCNKTISLSIESKSMVEDLLVITRAQAIFWTFIIVIIVPSSVLLVGIFVTRRRKHKSVGTK